MQFLPSPPAKAKTVDVSHDEEKDRGKKSGEVGRWAVALVEKTANRGNVYSLIGLSENGPVQEIRHRCQDGYQGCWQHES